MDFNKIFLAAVVLFMPTLASAHTRWFSEGEILPPQITEPTGLYLTILGTLAVAIVFIGILLHQKNILRFGFLRPWKNHVYERAASTFTMVAGTFFLIAGTHEYLFSPNLTIESGIPYVFIVIEIAIGLALILGIGTRIAALVLATAWALSFYYTGWLAGLENIWVLSTAAFIAIMGNDYFSIFSASCLREKFGRFKSYALSLLRLGTGVTLLTLGFSEKILNPELGLNFLAQYDWNFMQAMGLNYSNYLFVLSAGAVESLLGLVFILGIVTRLNALVTAVIFTIPLFILGPIELAGHLPHFAAVVLLLLFGNGGHFVFCRKYKDAKVG